MILTLLVILFLPACNESEEKLKVYSDNSDSSVVEVVTKQVIPDTVIKGNYAVSLYDTPVLYTKNFPTVYGGKNGKSLGFNKRNLVKELEYVAYPGTVFKILDEYNVGGYTIYKVYDPLYDIVLGGTDLYVDSRFVERRNEKPEPRKAELPSFEEIYSFFEKAMGSRYVWGANNMSGVEKMSEFYPPSGTISDFVYDHWTMTGFDCSGLIYQATDGYTPRNTHQMVSYGEPVEIEGLTANQIAGKLKPLDMIVWKGHVIYVYDENTTIESAYSSGGVVKKNLVNTLRDLMSRRKPVNQWSDSAGKIFVVRRWYPGN